LTIDFLLQVWGYVEMAGGELKDIKLMLTIDIYSVTLVDSNGLNTKGYLVEYCLEKKYMMTKVFIPEADYRKEKLLHYFGIATQGKKKDDDLLNRLLKCIIYQKAMEKPAFIDIGKRQGFNLKSTSKVAFETREKYPEELYPVIPEGILLRERPRKAEQVKNDPTFIKEYLQILFSFLNSTIIFRILYLIRITSYLLTFGAKMNVFFNQLIVLIPNEKVTNAIITAIVKNDNYHMKNTMTLGDKSKELEKNIAIYNDAVLLVADETKADESERRKLKLEALETAAVTQSENNFIGVIISRYAASQVRNDICCSLLLPDIKSPLEPNYVSNILEFNDALFVGKIEENFDAFGKMFNREMVNNIRRPHIAIPEHRKQAYALLMAAANVYDQFMEPIFDEKVLGFLVNWLSDYTEHGNQLDEKLLSDFAVCLNSAISEGKFDFIPRRKYMVIDKKTHTAVVDEDNVYFPTADIKELVESEMNLHSVNSLTDILKANECLTINDQNSKCYRFHVQNSESELYMLYTYGISKQLINAENRKRLDMAEYESFLLNFNELKESGILPLGVTSDGRFIGKDISYKNKSNDSICITGKSGEGKSFYATNIIPSLAMLGSRMLIFDVSCSFTRDEVLRSLPEEVVDSLFEFIYVGTGQCKLPVNPLYIGDCTNIPAKKRRIMSFIKAICKLDKEETKIIEGIVSDMLKRNNFINSISGNLLGNALKKGGKVGDKVYNLISSTLDDIELIGVEAQDWGDFFEKSKKIPVILLGDETDDKVHTVLDILVASAFAWQRDHNDAPLSVVIDEIKMQNFSEGSPLHTILTQGRKFNTKLIGMTQQYISNGSHSIDVMKEAGIKLFFKPAKSLDRIAAELEFKNPVEAGFGSMGIGDVILCCEAYDKVKGKNSHIVIHCKTVPFTETPLYLKFKAEYHIF